MLTVEPSSASPFAQPLTIEVPYDPAALAARGIDPASLVILIVHPGAAPRQLPTEVDAVARVVRARTAPLHRVPG